MTPARSLFGAVARPIQVFLRLEAASGILLLTAAAAALAWANLAGESYRAFFHQPFLLGAGAHVVSFSLHGLINDGLMTLFFFVVGMEIKRELAIGELNTRAKASLPLIAALGGMLVPSAIYVAFNRGGPGMSGWGIPMATDIAFSIGVLTLLGSRVPRALVVFLTALAIFDDIGGILVIALFYGQGLHLGGLLWAAILAAAAIKMGRSRVSGGLAYAVVGMALWYAMHASGIHATIAGVVLGFAVPARPRRPAREVLRDLSEHAQQLLAERQDEELGGAEVLGIEQRLEELASPLSRFVLALHPWVAFLIMPVFALANSGVELPGLGLAGLASPVALGCALGLFVGKQVGVFGSTALAVRAGLAPLPGRAGLVQLHGVATVAGIGFTVALFIATLAFPNSSELLDQAKVGILAGSFASGIVGYAILRSVRRPA